MRDQFEFVPPLSPAEAVRRSQRPALARRFYEKATPAEAPGDKFELRLDGKPVRTPAGRVLAAPTYALAEAVAAEWNAQGETIEPAKMSLTRLANVIIDGVAERPEAVADEVERYLASDLVFYRARSPQGLVERQARHWNPIVDWAAEALGAHFELGEGVIHVTQPEAALVAGAAAIPSDPWRLGAVHAATTLSGSALIALALLRERLSTDAAWQAALVDEDWNMKEWGCDELALERRAFRFAEFTAAATVLRALGSSR